MVRTTWEDDGERRVIEDVRQFGWHIVCVTEDEEGPGFAYSIGLYHTLKQPEIIIIGLNNSQSMGRIINAIGQEMRNGVKFDDWRESGSILDGCNCLFRLVDRSFYREYFGYGLWFYQGANFPAMQCIWPDSRGRYPSHPEFPAQLHARQPVLALDRSWPFNEGKNRGVFTTTAVLDGTLPILLVTHEEDGDWQFLCGTTNRQQDCRVVCLAHIVNQHPAVVELADLPVGWDAVRDGPDQPWQRIKRDDPDRA